MAAFDVTIAQNGGQGNVKLHPYLIALVRWCVSRIWGTAAVLIHRLLTAPLPPIPVSKHTTRSRQASYDHLHPEPRVKCVVLHQPPERSLDVIFVHGLYGSLGNTWRQGEWRSKYNLELNAIPLKRSSSIPTNCNRCDRTDKQYTYGSNIFNFESDFKDQVTFRSIDEKFYKNIEEILPDDEVYITEKFYNNTLLNQVEIVDNYETRAKFVQELFEEEFIDHKDVKETIDKDANEDKDCKCKSSDVKCEVGCGCICDECYSSCWPRDWIRVDHPGARVISINYTSDPYLWRPLWIKESKRLRLHERAEQMTQQLLDLGVGEKPIIWVGHSKGGLFIKQIYCEAYEAYLKLKNNSGPTKDFDKVKIKSEDICTKHNVYYEINIRDIVNNNTNEDNTEADAVAAKNLDKNGIEGNNYYRDQINEDNTEADAVAAKNINDYRDQINNNCCKNTTESNCASVDMVGENLVNDNRLKNIETDNDSTEINHGNRGDSDVNVNMENVEAVETACRDDSPNSKETKSHDLKTRASLWCNSAGFMFYSVPHRGSPLADIKTPITARSVELLEISKDCSLVLSLQDRWLRATASSQPVVRSLVETCRTLMSVLWLRIVSVDSADPGIGALCGVSVDHREICKPSSRRCLLYTELMKLINAAINRCRCQ